MQKTQKKNKKSQKTKSERGAKATVALPIAVSRVRRTRGSVPSIQSAKNSPDGRILVTHREYIKEIRPNGAVFEASRLCVNPGLKESFPWLSGLATHYESYLFRKLNYSFEPLLGTGTAGAVILAIDYDAADQIPVTKQTLMAYHHAMRSPIWSPLRCAADKPDLKKFGIQRYVRSHALTDGLDIKTYDVGQLIMATQGYVPFGDAIIGELYVDYTVELITPHLSDYVPPALAGTITPDPATLLTTSPFGNLQAPLTTITGQINDMIDIPNSNPRTLIFKKIGKYLLERFNRANGLNASPGQLNAWNGATLGETINSLLNGDNTQLLRSDTFEITQPGQGIYLDNVGQANLNLSKYTLSPYSY